MTYGKVLDVHLSVPETSNFIEILSLGVFDMALDRIVGTRYPPFDLELDIGLQTCLWTLDRCMISKLVF